MFTAPTIADFKSKFARDFPFGNDVSTSVTDADITSALTEATLFVNDALFGDQDSYTFAALYYAAHALVMNLRASSAGAGGSFSWLAQSKSVGSVSESTAIPQKILDNPQFAMLSKTNYGAKYLNIIIPLIAGNVGIVGGGTLP